MGRLIEFPHAVADDAVGGTETLAGLEGVHVVVEDLGPDVAKEGIGTEMIRRDVEERLAGSGIRVFSREQLPSASGLPLLYLQIGTDRHSGGAWAYLVRIELCQWVSLSRDEDIETMAATWIIAGVWATSTGDLATDVMESVREGVDRFITAYVAANATGPAN